MAVTQKNIVEWIEKSAEVLIANSEMLTDLDSKIGDADHGINMKRGFESVLKKIDRSKGIGDVLKGVAMALISSVGGAAGPLYGTIYLEMAKELKDCSELSGGDVGTLMATAVQAIQMRGKAEENDKTMLDSWLPASAAFSKAYSSGQEIADALAAAADAAERGAENTIPLIARKGRASYLGERSRGHKDPGATSSALIIRALSDVVAG